MSSIAGEESGSSGEASSSTSTASGTETPAGTTGADTSDASASTDASGSTHDAGTDPEPVEVCLRGTPQPMLDPEDTLLRILDTDRNGRDQLWMSQLRWDPLREIQSSVLRAFELDERGVFVPLAELELPGNIQALADIDGDGLLDVMLAQWDDLTRWWQVGVMGFDIDATARPLDGVDPVGLGSWIEVTEDDAMDYVERSNEFGFRILVGDGAGGFEPAGTSALEKLSPHSVFPVPALGQLVLIFQAPVLGFVNDISVVQTVAVDANGDLEILAQSGGLDISPRFVGDLDGDDIADVVGFDGVDNTLRFLGSARGPYEKADIVPNIRDAVVGGFVQEREVEILWWNGKAQMRLQRAQGAAWSEETPVADNPQWDANGPKRVLARARGRR